MMEASLSKAVETMRQEISAISELYSFLLYGSVVLNDFRLGWSDVDFIAFTKDTITETQAARLLTLRQTLSLRHPEDPYYRCFEGVIVSLREYLTGEYTRLIYWGTSGQRITDRCRIDPFTRYELVNCSSAVLDDNRTLFTSPTKEELVAAVREHYRGIRTCAVQTDDSLYSCGWILDIARCIRTLRCFDVIGKTQAGEWALSERLFADEGPLKRTLEIRRSPLQYKDDATVKAWLRSLGPTVQQYADVLERELARFS